MLDAADPMVDVIPAAPDARAEFLADVLSGLSRPQKEIPCKWLYDARGSHLFEQICGLEEYYPTRTELGIMETDVRAMASLLGPECALIEYGSGSSLKTRLLLQHLVRPCAYLPIDISAPALADATSRLARAFPDLRILPLCADFTAPIDLPLAGVDAIGTRRWCAGYSDPTKATPGERALCPPGGAARPPRESSRSPPKQIPITWSRGINSTSTRPSTAAPGSGSSRSTMSSALRPPRSSPNTS